MALEAAGNSPEPFVETAWLRTAVRSKPYRLPEAAQLCKDLDIKNGWLEVQHQEIKKSVA